MFYSLYIGHKPVLNCILNFKKSTSILAKVYIHKTFTFGILNLKICWQCKTICKNERNKVFNSMSVYTIHIGKDDISKGD